MALWLGYALVLFWSPLTSSGVGGAGTGWRVAPSGRSAVRPAGAQGRLSPQASLPPCSRRRPGPPAPHAAPQVRLICAGSAAAAQRLPAGRPLRRRLRAARLFVHARLHHPSSRGLPGLPRPPLCVRAQARGRRVLAATWSARHACMCCLGPRAPSSSLSSFTPEHSVPLSSPWHTQAAFGLVVHGDPADAHGLVQAGASCSCKGRSEGRTGRCAPRARSPPALECPACLHQPTNPWRGLSGPTQSIPALQEDINCSLYFVQVGTGGGRGQERRSTRGPAAAAG